MQEGMLKDKMESLDALGSGIVYGRDEAWDKLQARMDKRPARRIGLWVSLAAAAMLLLFVGISLLNRQADPQVARMKTEPRSGQQATLVPISAVATAVTEPVVVTERKSATPRQVRKVVPVAFTAKDTAIVPGIIDAPATVAETGPLGNEIITKAEVVPVMRVVHVNELDRDVPGRFPVAVQAVGTKPANIPVLLQRDLDAEGSATGIMVVSKTERMRGNILPVFGTPHNMPLDGDDTRGTIPNNTKPKYNTQN